MEERRIWKRFRVVAEVECDGLHEGLARVTARTKFKAGEYKIVSIKEVADDRTEESTD